MKKSLFPLIFVLAGCATASKSGVSESPPANSESVSKDAPSSDTSDSAPAEVLSPTKPNKTFSYDCKKWVQFDSKKNDYVPISASACEAFECKKTKVSVTGNINGSVVVAHIDDRVQYIQFVQSVGIAMNGGSTYSTAGYEFWISPDGKIKRLTMPGGRVSTGVECK